MFNTRISRIIGGAVVGAILWIALGALLGTAGCGGNSNDWVWYDAEYIPAETIENITCVAGLQGNHYGWEDPQPDHGNDGEHGHKGCRKHGNHDCDEDPTVPECSVEVLELPAYFILRNAYGETLHVNADSLMRVRPGMTECDELVAIHVLDFENPDILWYPFFIFDENGIIVIDNYFRWLNILYRE